MRLRSALTQVPAYVPGKPAAPREGVTAYKLSSNENPYPPLPGVLEVVQEAATAMNRYPDMAVTALSQALADTLGVPVEHIATGTGCVGVLGQIIQAFCDPGDEVVFAWRSFEAYPIVTALAGATAVRVGLDEHCRHDLDAMLAAITERTRVVLVCTPNNPTGPIVHHDELERFLDAVPRRRPGRHRRGLPRVRPGRARRPTRLALYRDRPNVVVLRTFSKAYGLAGLRVGYAVAHEPVAAALRKTAVPFGVNSLAQAAAVASLRGVRRAQGAGRRAGGRAHPGGRGAAHAGLGHPRDRRPTSSGSRWASAAPPSPQAAQEAGLTVRQFGGDGVRVTIGETEANDVLIHVAGEFLAETSS